MATLGANYPTIADLAKRLDPNGSIAAVAEILNQTNEVLMDMPWFEGNLPTGHRTTVRTGLPAATWRKLNGGVTPTKSNTAQIDEACGMLEAYNQVDKALADLSGNTAAFRTSEAIPQIEGMNQTMASTLFYGDTTLNPERFLGLAQRFNSLSAANGQNIVSGGGSGSDNTSLWMIQWGKHSIHGIYPKGSKAGLAHTDKGQITSETTGGTAGSLSEVYRDHFKWDCGIALRDWRYVVRIANVDVSNLVAESSNADLIKLLIKAKHRLPSMNMGRTVIYANRTVRQMLDIQALNKSNSALSVREAAGQFETNFLGIPIRTCDAILETEATIS